VHPLRKGKIKRKLCPAPAISSFVGGLVWGLLCGGALAGELLLVGIAG
jgi:hypothetical protein